MVFYPHQFLLNGDVDKVIHFLYVCRDIITCYQGKWGHRGDHMVHGEESRVSQYSDGTTLLVDEDN